MTTPGAPSFDEPAEPQGVVSPARAADPGQRRPGQRRQLPWLRGHYGYERGETPPVQHLLLRVEPGRGLGENDFEALRTWTADRAAGS